MSWKSKAWAFAGTVAALEELSAKNLCPCNSSLESLHRRHHHHQKQQAVQNMRPLSTRVEASSSSPSSSSPSSSRKISKKRGKQENLDQSEDSLRKIMYLSCWGPI